MTTRIPTTRITPELRRTIQGSGESIRTLARRYHISPATVQKWRNRSDTVEMQRGPKRGHSTAVANYVEQALVLFRQQTLLPLDDCLYALRLGIPSLTRATLHRYFRKRGLSSNLTKQAQPAICEGDDTQLGYIHIGLMRIRVRAGEVILMNGFDRLSKLAFATIEESVSTEVAAEFVRKLADAVPFKIHTVQTDNLSVFAESTEFARACAERTITHRVVPGIELDPQLGQTFAPPQIEPQVPDFEDIREVRHLLAQRVDEYNFCCKLKALRGHTPMEYASQYALG